MTDILFTLIKFLHFCYAVFLLLAAIFLFLIYLSIYRSIIRERMRGLIWKRWEIFGEAPRKLEFMAKAGCSCEKLISVSEEHFAVEMRKPISQLTRELEEARVRHLAKKIRPRMKA